MSPEEEDAVQAELAELERQALVSLPYVEFWELDLINVLQPAIPSVPEQQPGSLPSVPIEEPAVALPAEEGQLHLFSTPQEADFD